MKYPILIGALFGIAHNMAFAYGQDTFIDDVRNEYHDSKFLADGQWQIEEVERDNEIISLTLTSPYYLADEMTKSATKVHARFYATCAYGYGEVDYRLGIDFSENITFINDPVVSRLDVRWDNKMSSRDSLTLYHDSLVEFVERATNYPPDIDLFEILKEQTAMSFRIHSYEYGTLGYNFNLRLSKVYITQFTEQCWRMFVYDK